MLFCSSAPRPAECAVFGPLQSGDSVQTDFEQFVARLGSFLELRRRQLADQLLDFLQGVQHLSQLGRLIDGPIFLRCEANARAVRAAALVGAAERRRGRPGRGHELGHRQARREDLCLESSMSCSETSG